MGWIADLLKEIPSAARYKSELEAMEKENTALKRDNARLQEELAKLKPQDAGALGGDAEKVLVLVSKNDSSTAAQIARALRLSKQVAEMHLEDLLDSGHVGNSLIANADTEYYLAQPGRRYLHTKGLL